MSADLLRRAATVLRQHAQAASLSPWVAAEDGLVWPPRLGDPVSGSSAIEDARYIALMQPTVALALADLLDAAADARDLDPAEPPRNPRDRAVVFNALYVARAVLRGEES